MENKMLNILRRQFDSYRFIFWEDPKGESHADYEVFKEKYPEIECCEVNHNEIALKYRVLREEPLNKFLIYQGYDIPVAEDWLYDMKLASHTFKSDKIDIWRTDLGLPESARPILEQYRAFFSNGHLKEKLRHHIKPTGMSNQALLRAMVAACVGTVPELCEILQKLLKEYTTNPKNHLFKSSGKGFLMLQGYALEDALWDWFAEDLNFRPMKPTLDEFVFEFFGTCCNIGSITGTLNSNAQVYMNRWATNTLTQDDFVRLANYCAQQLKVDNVLANATFEELEDKWCFVEIDVVILQKLIDAITNRSINLSDVESIIQTRREMPWYRMNSVISRRYEACLAASRFFNLLLQTQLDIESLDKAWKLYTSHFYKLDQLYRHYCVACESGSDNVLKALTETVESFYNTQFVSKLALNFQILLDKSQLVQIPGIKQQRAFFKTIVDEQYLSKGRKVAVIISDGLRYEVAEELKRQIVSLDRYDAQIESVQSSVPTYTKLGMASLLPHDALELQTDSNVLADGKNTSSFDSRVSLLQSVVPASQGYKYADLIGKTTNELKDIVRNNDLIYVWHDTIDASGENHSSSNEAPQGAVAALNDIVALVKKLASSNMSHLLITADHGFLYRMSAVPNEDMAEDRFEGAETLDRRFAIGTSLMPSDASRHFTANELGLEGNAEVVIPNGVMRFRCRGNAGRYAHGGRSLQEMVVPVVAVRKLREGTTSTVDVTLVTYNRAITTSKVALKFYQVDKVSEKLRPRTLRVKFVDEKGEDISSVVTVTFDCMSDNKIDLEKQVTLDLRSNLDLKNGDKITLVMDEPIQSTSRFVEYNRINDFVYRNSMFIERDDFF